LLVMVGDCECLHDQVLEFIRKAKGAGLDVSEYIAPGMVHVWPAFHMFSRDDLPPIVAYERMKEFIYRVLENPHVESI
jgi:acetyl esterase/lipase